MATGWQYRLASVTGVAVLTGGSVGVANLPVVQRTAMSVPIVSRLPPTTLDNGTFSLAIATAVLVVIGAFVPLFKPQPRRRLDMLVLVEKRVVLAVTALAAIGYFDDTYRLPRTTLLLLGVCLALSSPVWFVLIRGRPDEESRRVVIVGDDPETIEDVLDSVDVPVVGYISPPPPRHVIGSSAPDGGKVAGATRLSDLECLGGLSRLAEVLVGYDVDTAVLAFSQPDRAEFFGTLDTCYAYDVTAKVHRTHADTVLTSEVGTDDLVDVELEPWDWQNYLLKRAFDVCFAAVGLVLLAPAMAAIAVAVKLDSEGPVLHSPERTAEFGDTFTVYKFRTMVHQGVDTTPAGAGENDRITRVGRVLRVTHLDELPLLWSILLGRMSVVGPRAAWTDEATLLEETTDSWRTRWFVKPGLTGLAQINDATSTTPEEKFRYDVTYIRKQSFWTDLKILVRQVWKTTAGVGAFLFPSGRR